MSDGDDCRGDGDERIGSVPSNLREATHEVQQVAPRELRKAVRLPGHAIGSDGTSLPITLLDLSHDGCKIATPVALKPGTSLKLSVLPIGDLNAEVRWSTERTAGLSFNVQKTPETEYQPREHQRRAVNAEVLLRQSGRQRYSTRLLDLSPVGCRIEFVEKPRLGDRLWVKIGNLDALEGEVRWIEGHVGGMEFLHTIHPAVFDLLLESLDRMERPAG